MDNNYEKSLVDQAIIFASKAHFGQKRKGKDVPYILHPLEAMTIVSSMTNDEELLAASVLHDVIEDTEYTYEDLKKLFGERVADLVREESDYERDDKEHAATWVERKKIALEKLKTASRDVKMVALSDKLANIRDMSRDYMVAGEKLWERFNITDPKVHEWRYRELVKALDSLEGLDAYTEFAYRVDKLFKKTLKF